MSRKKNDNDKGWGLQPIEVKKAALEAILEVHKQRKEAAQATEQPEPKIITLPVPPAPMQESGPRSTLRDEPAQAANEHSLPSTEEVKKWTGSDDYEAQQDESAVQTPSGVVFVQNPQDQPALYIQIRTPELQDYDSAGVIFEVTTGRYLITWRLRRPEDGDAEFVYGEAHYKHKVDPDPPVADPEAKAHADRIDWLRRSLNGDSMSGFKWAPGKVDPPRDNEVNSGSFGGASRRPGDR